MTEIIQGERIGKTAPLKVGCSAIIFDSARQKALLTRRADNGKWCAPGGHMEPGESAAEACIRETLEETGLLVKVVKLIGIYTSPNRIVRYQDGNCCQPIVLSFEAVPIDGKLGLSSETIDVGYFSLEDMLSMEMMPLMLDRIRDAFACREMAFIR